MTERRTKPVRRRYEDDSEPDRKALELARLVAIIRDPRTSIAERLDAQDSICDLLGLWAHLKDSL